jgi:hypothetical protein
MIYIEYMEHDRSIPAELLKSRGEKARWPEEEAFSDNHPLAVLGRTLRLGPHPPYLTIWQCRTFEKLEEWDSYFKVRKNLHSTASQYAIHLCQAGCYSEVLSGPPIENGIQYIEFFKHDVSRQENTVSQHFSERVHLYENGILNAVLCRMGPLGPEPGGLAIWTFHRHGDIEGIVLDHQWQKVLNIVRSGLYRKLGDEA